MDAFRTAAIPVIRSGSTRSLHYRMMGIVSFRNMRGMLAAVLSHDDGVVLDLITVRLTIELTPRDSARVLV
jgi:hypothetical protein